MDVNDAMDLAEIIAKGIFEGMHNAHIVCLAMKDDKAIIVKHTEIWDYLKDPDKWIANC